MDGLGVHKLVHKAIMSASVDLRKEMARSVFLCGGLSRIPGLRERLERELRALLPPALTVKVCSKANNAHVHLSTRFHLLFASEYNYN